MTSLLTWGYLQGVTVTLSLFLGSDRRKSFLSSVPVSYTHLDVYKRQGLVCAVALRVMMYTMGETLFML